MTDLPMITMERRYRAALADLWALWTTPEGLESWWGPPGFAVTVQQMDLRAGGALRYTMTATAPEMVAFMQANGMPTATPAQAVYDAVDPMTRLAYRHLVDFVPGRASYETRMVVTFAVAGDQVTMTLTFDRMHDAEWTERQRMGWELELGKLAALLAARGLGQVL
jgi:uncharacterized protein YndB with AHSA1/START domain